MFIHDALLTCSYSKSDLHSPQLLWFAVIVEPHDLKAYYAGMPIQLC